MKVVFIKYPHLFTDDGDQIEIDMISGHPKVGAELIPAEKHSGYMYKVASVTSDSECVNGVCPVR